MGFNKNNYWAVVTLLFSGSASVNAADTEVNVLDSITVTTTRVEEKNTEVAANIGTKEQAEIKLDAPVLQKELFNSVAGVRVTQTGSTVGHMTSIRMPTNTGPYYLFLQDGVPIQSPGFFNHNGLAYTNYSSAGKAEVLKGTGTALYGSDSIAATINVLSKDISGDDGYSVNAELGSDGFKKLGVSAEKTVEGDSSIYADVSHTDSDGWRDHTAHTRDEVTIKHTQYIDDNNELKTVFIANKTDAEMAGDLIGLDELYNNTTSVGNIASAISSGLEINRKFDFVRLSTELINDYSKDIQLNTTAYLRTNRNRYIATWENNLPQNDSKENTIGLMFKADITSGEFNYIAGIDTEYTQSSREYTQLFNYVPSGWGSAVDAGKIYDYEVDFYSVSPYLRTEYDVNDKLQIAGGLRYDANGFDYTNNLADGQYGSSSYSRASDDTDPDFTHLSPKADLSYKPTINELIYFRYANGFRIPSASRLYSLRTNNIAFTLEPEKSNSFEFGYKKAAASYEFGASVYHMTIEDTIVGRKNASNETFYVNGDDSIHKGLELSLTSELSNQFKTKVAYSYSEHNYNNDIQYGDNEQAAAPNDIANVRLFYTPDQLKTLTAMLEWEHVGDYWLDDDNTIKYKGYDAGHLKVTYDPEKNLSLFFKVNNITDRVYAETASFSYGSERYTPAAPRQFFAGMKYKF